MVLDSCSATTSGPASPARRRSQLAEGTCEAMARGGMYDQLGGGFARYSVDAGWVVPHFEKMLYDNALLARVYTHLWRRTGSALARRVAEETCDWMLRELRTADGGFAASLDADSEGEEGKFYVWTPAELTRSSARGRRVRRRGLRRHRGRHLRARHQGPAAPADPADASRLGRVRARPAGRPAGRVRPGRDDKVVAAWNGLAITALAECGLLLERPDLTAAARGGPPAGRGSPGGGRLVRTSRDGVAGTPPGCWRTTPASPRAS